MRRWLTSFLVAALLLAVHGASLAQTTPSGSARGPLRVHPTNPRYFTDGTRTPDGSLRAVYLTGAHTWNNLVDIGPSDPPPAFDYGADLDLLQKHNHNFIRLWTEEEVGWEITSGSAPAVQDFMSPLPWARTSPGVALDGKPKFDLSRFNSECFDRLRSRVERAGQRGIYVSVMLFEGRAWHELIPDQDHTVVTRPAGKLIPAGRGDTRQPEQNAKTGGSASAVPGPAAEEPAARLAAYRTELESFRKEYGGTRDLPDVRFFLFGMGQRAKFIYRDGRLRDARSGKVVHQWKLKNEVIVPPDYLVALQTDGGSPVNLVEDEEAVWMEVGGKRTALEGTRSPVKLPTFAGHRYGRVLRVLHQELLVNVTSAGPVPNFFVYPKPWYRDGAMMALAFRETGNLGVIRDWILGLREPFDRNNGGVTEPDNLGQALFLISLVSDKNHPLVTRVLAELPRFEREGAKGKYIVGRTDGAEHPVYQTKWLKFGLRALELPDNHAVPSVQDGYSALFWMDNRDAHVAGNDSDSRTAYPYLGWACDHFHRVKKSPISNRDYPLTWEQNASQAKYSELAALDPVYVEKKLSAPHTWHAAEVFLHVLHGERQRY